MSYKLDLPIAIEIKSPKRCRGVLHICATHLSYEISPIDRG